MTAAVIATNGLNLRFGGGGGGITTPEGVVFDSVVVAFLVSSGGGIAIVLVCVEVTGILSKGFLASVFTVGWVEGGEGGVRGSGSLDCFFGEFMSELIKSSDSCFDLSGAGDEAVDGGIVTGVGGVLVSLFSVFVVIAGFAGSGWGSDGFEGVGVTPGIAEGGNFLAASKISMIGSMSSIYIESIKYTRRPIYGPTTTVNDYPVAVKRLLGYVVILESEKEYTPKKH